MAQGSKVKVEPRDDVDSRNGTNFIMTAEKSGASKNVDVTQDDVYWNFSEITANDYEGTAKPGDIDGSELTLGVWNGDLTFLINFEDEYGDSTGGKTDTIMIAPKNEASKWYYKLNRDTQQIELISYYGDEKDLTVYSKYIVEMGQEYDETTDQYKSIFAEYSTKLGNEFYGGFDNGAESVYFAKDIDTTELNTAHLFRSDCIKYIDISNLDMGNVTNMFGMFEGCSSLERINFGNINTSNVTTMMDMFAGCESLTSIDLSKFDTSNVTEMGGMFDGCKSLANIDLSGFETHNVERFGNMFRNCESLKKIDLSNFDTSNTGDDYYAMSNMFDGCKSLTDINVSSFDTSNVEDFSGMFSNCESLVEVDISNFVINNPSSMFYNIPKLERIYVSKENIRFAHLDMPEEVIIRDLKHSFGLEENETVEIIFK